MTDNDHLNLWLEDEGFTLGKSFKKIYLRFGMFGRRERSMNWITSEYERGISVYPAKIVDGIVHLDDDELYQTAEDVANGSDAFEGRFVFVLTGRESKFRGTDNEPLLQPSSIKLLPLPVSLEIQPLVARS